MKIKREERRKRREENERKAEVVQKVHVMLYHCMAGIQHISSLVQYLLLLLLLDY